MLKPSGTQPRPTSVNNVGVGPRPSHPQQTAIKSYVNLHTRRASTRLQQPFGGQGQPSYADSYYGYPRSYHTTPTGQVYSQQPRQSGQPRGASSSWNASSPPDPAEIQRVKDAIARKRLARKKHAFSSNPKAAKQMMEALAALNFQITEMEMMEPTLDPSDSDSSGWATTDDSEDDEALGSEEQEAISAIPLPSDPPPSPPLSVANS